MGLVLLVGLVVKNGILLISAALVHRDGGDPVDEALVLAAERRMRPILMTTACTVFGLVPLAFALGPGSELQRPLAVAVIGGLVVSTAGDAAGAPCLGAVGARAITGSLIDSSRWPTRSPSRENVPAIPARS